MAYIDLPPDMPGIMGLMKYRPDTGKILSDLAEALLQGDSSLSRGDRELIAAFVSNRNQCNFCQTAHGEIARHLLDSQKEVVDQVFSDVAGANVSEKMKALLNIAAKVQVNGKEVDISDINHAQELGATQREIHDTVLIAAAFCMFNRYVDGLGTTFENKPELFKEFACQIADMGYAKANKPLFEN